MGKIRISVGKNSDPGFIHPGSATLLPTKHLSLVVVMKVLLLVVVKGVSRGSALLTDVAGEDGHYVVCLDVPRHVISPTEDVANKIFLGVG